MQKTVYEMRIIDWSSDVCSSDLVLRGDSLAARPAALAMGERDRADHRDQQDDPRRLEQEDVACVEQFADLLAIAGALRERRLAIGQVDPARAPRPHRKDQFGSEEEDRNGVV